MGRRFSFVLAGALILTGMMGSSPIHQAVLVWMGVGIVENRKRDSLVPR